MTCGIYCIENTLSNKKYIGQSVNIEKRIISHKCYFRNNTHVNFLMQKAWNKYGENNFSFYVLEKCDKKELNDKEVLWIKNLNAYYTNDGYNLTRGGTEEYKFSEEQRKMYPKLSKRKALSERTKKRMSEYHKSLFIANPHRFDGENNPFYNKQHSEETKQKISIAKKGSVVSEETKIKISKAEKGKILSDETKKKISDSRKQLFIDNPDLLSGDKNPFFGKKHSEETRQRMSNARKIYLAKKGG